MMLNGHIYPAVDKMPWGTSYKERPLLFHNKRGNGFSLVPAVQGSGLAVVASARGVAFGDLFNDGKVDVVINNIDGTPTLLRDVSAPSHEWVEINLVGAASSVRDGVGASLRLEAGGRTQREDNFSGGSFLSSNDQRAHFGLGDADAIDRLTVHWPTGKVEVVSLPHVNTIYTVGEGRGVLDPVPGVIAPPATLRYPSIDRQQARCNSGAVQPLGSG